MLLLKILSLVLPIFLCVNGASFDKMYNYLGEPGEEVEAIPFEKSHKKLGELVFSYEKKGKKAYELISNKNFFQEPPRISITYNDDKSVKKIQVHEYFRFTFPVKTSRSNEEYFYSITLYLVLAGYAKGYCMARNSYPREWTLITAIQAFGYLHRAIPTMLIEFLGSFFPSRRRTKQREINITLDTDSTTPPLR